MRPHVKPGGCYRIDEGQIVVDSITSIRLEDITHDLARESGFSSVQDLLETAKHGPGENVYLIRFRYLPPGAWTAKRTTGEDRKGDSRPQLLRRIRNIKPKRSASKAKILLTTPSRRRHEK